VYSEENILFGGMGWIELAQYRAQWRTFTKDWIPDAFATK
jgi:hypothetical protein